MNVAPKIVVNDANLWRVETPGGSETWEHSPYPDAANKYFMVSADTHLQPPVTLIKERIAEKFKDRVPKVEKDEKGRLWSVADGLRWRIMESDLEGEDLYRTKAGSSATLEGDSNNLDKRMADLDLDGVDAELVFPNGVPLAGFWTKDAELMGAIFRIYNDWAAEISRPYRNRMNIAACIATGDVAAAVKEVEHVAKLGYRCVVLPNKPVFNSSDLNDPNYNSPEFDPLWAVLQETDLTVTYHVSTGADPRGAKGPGGAVTNFAVHCVMSTGEPIAHMCASGLLDRFPKLRFAAVESGVGWIHWFLDAMDEAYLKHHMWAFPKLRHGLPSEYFKAQGGATFGEDRAGLGLIQQHGLEDNFCWANDYPHHEGTFPHSAQSIERQMGHLDDATRAKLLGLNAARLFNFEVPAEKR